MDLNNVKDWLQRQKTGLDEALTRYKNKDFMDAVVAGCALVAAADGNISSEEKQKMAGFIQRSEALKVFDMAQIIARFNHFTEAFQFDGLIGKAEALKSVGRIKQDPAAARLLVRVCCAIGAADGDFDADEQGVVREICVELHLDPLEFGLGEGTPAADSTDSTPAAPTPAQDTSSTEASEPAPPPAPETKAPSPPAPIQEKDSSNTQTFDDMDFLRAGAAGCALMAVADGVVKAEEVQKASECLRGQSYLQNFETAQIDKQVKYFIDNLSFNLTIGKAEAMNCIKALKNKPAQAEALLAICRAVAEADGVFDAREKALLREIGAALEIDAARFNE